MTYTMLFNRAYALCVRFDRHAIALAGIVNFLTQLQGF